MATTSFDVDSIWITSRTLSAFKIPEGMHRLAKHNVTSTVVADFSKKSTVGRAFSAFFLIPRCEFPVEVFLSNISGKEFFASLLVPSLKALPKGSVTSYHNGRWLWTDSPRDSFEAQKIKSIALHTADFQALERSICRRLADSFPHAAVLYGVYQNGLHGQSEKVLLSLRQFLMPDALEHVIVHKAVEISVPTGTVGLAMHAPLQGCRKYNILGSPTLRSFTCDGRRLPDMCAGMEEHISYVQGYYPIQSHAGNVNGHTNLPITLASIFAFRADNDLLRGLKDQAHRELAAARAALFAFLSGRFPYRIEAVTEWSHTRQTQADLEKALSMESMHKLVRNAFDGRHLCTVPQEECTELGKAIHLVYAELEEIVEGCAWPRTVEDLARVASLESLVLCCLRGSTQFVSYRCLKAALGGKTLGQALSPANVLIIPDDPLPLAAEQLAVELIASEAGRRHFHKPIDFFVRLLKTLDQEREASGRTMGSCETLARMVVRGVCEECDVPSLSTASITAAGRTLAGHTGFKDVLDALCYMQSSKPMRSLLALLVSSGGRNFCLADSDDEMERALYRALDCCDVFPRWRPIGSQDTTYRFTRLVLSDPDRQFSDALDFLEEVLRMRASRMDRLTSRNPDVQLCMKLAIVLGGGRAAKTRTWTAWLVLLIITFWRGPSASYRFFSWAGWKRSIGWEFVAPLLDGGLLIHEEGSEDFLLGDLKLAPRFSRRLENWTNALLIERDGHRQEVEAQAAHVEESNREPPTLEEPMMHARPRRKRRRGIASLLASQQLEGVRQSEN